MRLFAGKGKNRFHGPKTGLAIRKENGAAGSGGKRCVKQRTDTEGTCLYGSEPPTALSTQDVCRGFVE